MSQDGELIERTFDSTGALAVETLVGDVQVDMLSVGAYLDPQGQSVALFIPPASDRPLVALTFANGSDSVTATALLY